MKKLKMLLIPLFCMLFAVTTFASSSDVFTINVGDENVEIVFDDHTVFSETQKQHIAHRLVYGEEASDMQPYGLTCTLFGHDLTNEMVEVIHHKKKATSPRCYVEYYSVDSCSRCDYINEEFTGGSYRVCCPED